MTDLLDVDGVLRHVDHAAFFYPDQMLFATAASGLHEGLTAFDEWRRRESFKQEGPPQAADRLIGKWVDQCRDAVTATMRWVSEGRPAKWSTAADRADESHTASDYWTRPLLSAAVHLLVAYEAKTKADLGMEIGHSLVDSHTAIRGFRKLVDRFDKSFSYGPAQLEVLLPRLSRSVQWEPKFFVTERRKRQTEWMMLDRVLLCRFSKGILVRTWNVESPRAWESMDEEVQVAMDQGLGL